MISWEEEEEAKEEGEEGETQGLANEKSASPVGGASILAHNAVSSITSIQRQSQRPEAARLDVSCIAWSLLPIIL